MWSYGSERCCTVSGAAGLPGGSGPFGSFWPGCPDVLCELRESLVQRKSSGPCLPALQTGAREKTPAGRGADNFYLLLLSLWRVLPAARYLYSTPLLSIRKGMPSPFKRTFA